MLCSSRATYAQGTSANDPKAQHTSAAGLTWEYSRSGHGPTIVLIHGWPEDRSAWQREIPELARHFDVIAIDLPGVGGTSVPQGGAEKAIVAQRVHSLLRKLGVNLSYLVGHDVGAQVAYAYIRQYPREIRGAMLIETVLLGAGSTKLQIESLPAFWHFNFYDAPGVAEQLIEGKQKLYFRYFIDNGLMPMHHSVVSDLDVRRYARAYGSVQRLRATFDEYRAGDADQQWNLRHRTPISTPITLVAGDHGLKKLVPPLAAALRKLGCENVAVETIPNGAHYILDEQPEAVTALIEKYASRETARR